MQICANKEIKYNVKVCELNNCSRKNNYKFHESGNHSLCSSRENQGGPSPVNEKEGRKEREMFDIIKTLDYIFNIMKI